MKHRIHLLITSFALVSALSANTISINSGSLGREGDASNTDTVDLDQPGVLATNGDFSTGYSGRADHTRLPFNPLLNSPAPFTIEFWARPVTTDDDDAPVDNRIGGTGNRSGWAFFQRETGWNFRMYNGISTQTGFDITGGTAPLNDWSHVVATWDGTLARLYVNGVFADVPNASADGNSPTYAPSTIATLTIGALGDDTSNFNGRVDEVAFYGTALSADKIAAHHTARSSTVAGTYSNLVKADGALIYYQQNPATAGVTKQGANVIVSFTGILSKSSELTPDTWEDLTVTSPHTVTPSTTTPKLFFRAHR